jgi:heme a synthase
VKEPCGNAEAQRRRRLIAYWLLAVAGMVFAMVVIGGLTRLTESGLSIVEWKPATGWLPPLTHAQWEAEFRAYQAYPEYQKVNFGMSLEEFQGIYWLEYLHRLWGRLIGLAFALPFIVFLAKGWLDRPLAWKLAGAFVLGGLQGVLGWYMVKSGLVDRPDVSQYRLAAHLGLALVIYGYLFWVALALLKPSGEAHPAAAPVRWAYGLRAIGVGALVLVTMVSGAFVAGLDAGHAYNTFPLMDGDLIPAHLFASTPPWRSVFEDITTVQFVHRVLATVTLLSVIGFRLSLRSSALSPAAQWATSLAAGWVVVQFALGVATLLSFVALPLAALHQASAVVLWTLVLWSAFELLHGGAARPAAAPLSAARSRVSGGAAV